ncbi:MAG: prephenate dehydratase [Myxococcota bacterium]
MSDMAKDSDEPTEAANSALNGLRAAIDATDDEMLRLLNKRAELAQQIGKIKLQRQQKAYVPERERQVVDRLLQANGGPLPAASLRLIYKEIISASLALESPLEVAFLGPEATFTHEATKRHFGMSARLKPQSSIPNVFADVERGRCEYGVVPIENSTEGVVNHTLDSFMSSDLLICAEILLEVSHHLLNKTGSLSSITKIYSHPQALAQCRGWLHNNLAGIPLVDVSSTARAAQLAAEDPGAAAVASDLAASMYDLQIASSHLQDMAGNVTRFMVIGHDQPKPSGNDRTSIMFALKDSPGILYKALEPFARGEINMSRIESRPSKRRAWDYLFFIDFEGHRAEEPVAQAVESLTACCEFIKVLGSYPQGQLGGGSHSGTITDSVKVV